MSPDVLGEWFTVLPVGEWFTPHTHNDGRGLDVLGEWLTGDYGARLLWPVAWHDEGLDGDELGPASTARPWVVVEAAVVRRPRRMRFGVFMGLVMALAFTGPDSWQTHHMMAAHIRGSDE